MGLQIPWEDGNWIGGNPQHRQPDSSGAACLGPERPDGGEFIPSPCRSHVAPPPDKSGESGLRRASHGTPPFGGS